MPRLARAGAKTAGLFVLEYLNPAGEVEWVAPVPNGTTYQGANYLLSAGFLGGSKSGQWYVGLIDAAGFSEVDFTDTHAAHPGWTEYTGVYLSERPLWNQGAVGSSQVVSAASSVVQITAAGNVLGAFLANVQAVGTTPSGLLYCTGVALSPLAVAVGGTVKVSYQTALTPTS